MIPSPTSPTRLALVPDEPLADRLRQLSARLAPHIEALCPTAPEARHTAELLALGGTDARSPSVPPQGQIGPRLHAALSEPVRYVVDAGGQRWRPGLVLHVIELLGGDAERFAPLAAAAELMHAGSLMVDDVEDGGDLRRGQRAAHEAYGVPTALNAGTTTYFALHRAIRRTVPDDEPRLRAGLYDAYLEGLTAAHSGQALDIQGHSAEMDAAVRTGCAAELLERVRLTHRLKSGAMVGACLALAAHVTGAARETRAALEAFGTAVGTAYQFTNDVADLDGDVRHGRASKLVCEDLHNGKVTMPLALAVPLLPLPRLRELWLRVREGRADAATVRETARALRDCGATAACAHEAEWLLESTWRELEPLLPVGRHTRTLRDLAWHTVLGDHPA